MREMSEAEWRAFVSEGTRTGKLATELLVRVTPRCVVAQVGVAD